MEFLLLSLLLRFHLIYILCFDPSRTVMGHVLASTCLFDIKYSDAAPLRAPKTDLTHRELLHLSAAKELEAG